FSSAFRENEAVPRRLHHGITGKQQEDVQREEQRGETFAGTYIGEYRERAFDNILLWLADHPEDGQRVMRRHFRVRSECARRGGRQMSGGCGHWPATEAWVSDLRSNLGQQRRPRSGSAAR